jgi:hypothetical protein
MAWYARPDWDYGQIATAVTASAPDVAYDASNLNGVEPAKPAKLTTPSGFWYYTFSAKVAPVASAIIYQYLDPGLAVVIEASDDAFATTAFTQSVTVPNKRKDGPSYQRWTHNILTLIDTLPDPTGYRYWRLNVTGTNSQIVQVGRWMLLSALAPIDLFHTGGDIPESDDPDNVIDETERKVRIKTVIGGPQRAVGFSFIGTDLDAGTAPVQQAQDFRDLWESTDTDDLFIFIPQLHGADDDEPWLAFFQASPGRAHAQGGYQNWTGTIREASRGVPFK